MTKLPVVLSVRLSRGEYTDLLALCKKNNVTRQDMLRAVIVDVLVEEADAIRRQQPTGHSRSGEESETCGAATP